MGGGGGGLRNELAPFWAWKGGLRNELDPFLAWKWDSPELPGRVWLLTAALKMGLFGTARTRRANPRRWKWDSPELPGRVWLTRGASFGLSRPWEAMNGLKLKKFENYGLRKGKIRQKM